MDEKDIGALCEKFEKDAKALGYELEALALYNRRYERHQINWNDKIDKKIIDEVAENVALALWKVSGEDVNRVVNALTLSQFFTKAGAKKLANVFAEALTDAIEDANDTVKGIFTAGIEMGKKIVDSPETSEETLKLEGGNNDES